jgi:putative 4-mercaptohistidine N1-methyltranferase
MDINPYETEAITSRYLLFHYGHDFDYPGCPENGLHFPIRCVTECLETAPPHAKALDLGCAIGRSSFELARFCEKVVAIDASERFIAAAKQIQQRGQLEYAIIEEGDQQAKRLATLPEGIRSERVEFICADASHFTHPLAPFDVVLAANIICRLYDPRAFLSQLPLLVAPQGQLIITSPYSWSETYTPRANWLTGLSSLQEALQGSFDLTRAFDMPFLIREHRRHYEWGVAQASLWRRCAN